MIFRWTDSRETEAPPRDPRLLKDVRLSSAEWYALKDLIDQLRRPWVRNSNKDRDIRPARSSSGYVVLAAKATKIGGKNSYRISVETPYRLDSFDPSAAQELVKRDADALARELGYDEYRKAYSSYGSCLCNGQIDIDYTRNEYYHVVFEASTLPKVVIRP